MLIMKLSATLLPEFSQLILIVSLKAQPFQLHDLFRFFLVRLLILPFTGWMEIKGNGYWTLGPYSTSFIRQRNTEKYSNPIDYMASPPGHGTKELFRGDCA